MARTAGIGKSSLYRRYPDKETLFAKVVERSIQTMFDDMSSPEGQTLHERLRATGRALAESLLVPRCVALMRITAAEALNFPVLARTAYRVSFVGAVARVTDVLIGGGIDKPDAARLATRFVELVLQPLSFQAVFGASREALRERCLGDVDDALTVLVAHGLPH